MGGLAINGVSRLSVWAYMSLCADIAPLIEQTDGYIIKSYSSKESFGDIDILFPSVSSKDEFFNSLPYSVKEVKPNGPVTSVGVETPYGLFQFDLIVVSNVNWASVYFNYNDMGNLMGRIAHRLGFKYGHDGLWWVLRDSENPDYVIGTLLVTDDLKTAFGILGYSYEKYLFMSNNDEFDSLVDIFYYVIANVHFSSDIYLLENRNHIQRIRDRKRPTYMKFLAWCADSSNGVMPGLLANADKNRVRDLKLKLAFDLCPSFKESHDRLLKDHDLDRQMKVFWNGRNVSEWTGLEGKRLGKFMSHFSNSLKSLSPTHFRQWVLVPNSEDYKIDVIKKSCLRWMEEAAE